VSDSARKYLDERIFILNIIELCVLIFRGPDPEGWAGIIQSGLPELLNRAPEDSAHLTDSVLHLQESLKFSDNASSLEAAYVSLFISASGGVPAPLYESCHQEGKARTMGNSALAMRSRLEQAGLEVSLESNEPPDHLSIELEYLYHLLSTGWANGDPDLIRQGADFAETVMQPWVHRFRDRLAGSEPHPVFLSAADLVLVVLDHSLLLPVSS